MNSVVAKDHAHSKSIGIIDEASFAKKKWLRGRQAWYSVFADTAQCSRPTTHMKSR